MEYYWDESDLLRAKNDLIDLLNKEDNIYNKYYLRKVLDIFNEHYALEYFQQPVKKQKIGLTYHLNNLMSNVEVFGRYYYLVENFYFLLNKNYSNIISFRERIYKILNYFKVDDMLDINNKLVSVDDAVGMTDSFYNSYFPDLYPVFFKAFNQRDRHLCFTNESDQDTLGFCFFIDGIKENFIRVFNSPQIDKVFNTIHEYGHAIANLMNSNKVYNPENDFFSEVESMFPEFLAYYENPFNFPKEDCLSLIYFCLVTQFNASSNLVAHNVLLHAWEENKFKANYSYLNILSHDYSISKRKMYSILKTSISKDGPYILSFQVVLELIYLYRENPSKAMNIYKEIISRPSHIEQIPYVLERLDIGKHTTEMGDEIVDSFSKVLSKKEARL